MKDFARTIGAKEVQYKCLNPASRPVPDVTHGDEQNLFPLERDVDRLLGVKAQRVWALAAASDNVTWAPVTSRRGSFDHSHHTTTCKSV
jgi:hypothetical protein